MTHQSNGREHLSLTPTACETLISHIRTKQIKQSTSKSTQDIDYNLETVARCWKYGLKIWSEQEAKEVSSRTRAAIQAAGEGHTTCRNIRQTSYSDWKVTFRFLATGEYQLGFNPVTVRMWNTSTCVPSGNCPIKCTDTWQEIEHVECEQTSPKKSKQADRTGCCRKNVTLRYVFTKQSNSHSRPQGSGKATG